MWCTIARAGQSGIDGAQPAYELLICVAAGVATRQNERRVLSGRMSGVGESSAEVNTRLLRGESEPFWKRLRELLAERGLDPGRSALAITFPDDADLEFGIVVSEEGEIYEFDFTYGRRGDLQEQTRTGTLTAWDRVTDCWRERPFRDDIEAALGIIAAERT